MLGLLCKIPKHKGCSMILTMRENSLGVRGPKLFNTLSAYIRNITNVKLDMLK